MSIPKLTNEQIKSLIISLEDGSQTDDWIAFIGAGLCKDVFEYGWSFKRVSNEEWTIECISAGYIQSCYVQSKDIWRVMCSMEKAAQAFYEDWLFEVYS